MTTLDNRQQIVSFAMKLAGRIVGRVKHRSALANMDAEDIEQELMAYVLEHADRYDPARGNIEAFTTRLMQSAAAGLIRGLNRQRSNPPEGCGIDSLSKVVEGPDRKSEELIRGLTTSDGNRRRQTELRDPLRDVELADAVEHQIQSLPRRYRRIARLLRTHNQIEIANKLGWSKRKVSQYLLVIREHFSNVDWSDSGFSRDTVSADCIASSGEDNVFKADQESDLGKSA